VRESVNLCAAVSLSVPVTVYVYVEDIQTLRRTPLSLTRTQTCTYLTVVFTWLVILRGVIQWRQCNGVDATNAGMPICAPYAYLYLCVCTQHVLESSSIICPQIRHLTLAHTQIVQSQQEMMMRREQERAYTETVVFSQIQTEIWDSKAETDRLRSVLAEIGREGGPVAQMTNEYRSYRYDAYECVYVYISVSVCVFACVCMYVCMCVCAAYVCGHRCVSYKRSHALASVVNSYLSMRM